MKNKPKNKIKKQVHSNLNEKTNFGDKINSNGFKQNPQNINKSGANRKLISGILFELKEKGNEPVKPSTIIDAFENLFNLSEKEITEISNNESNPYFLRIVAKRMLSDNYNYDVIEKMLDRAHGKSKQSTDITSGGDKIETISKITVEYISPKE